MSRPRAARAEEEDPGGGDAGLNRVRYRYRLLPHVLALEHAGWCGRGVSGFRPDTVETRFSIANAPTSMTIRVTHIYRRIDGEWYLVLRHADFPPSDQRAGDQGTAGSGRA